jgi:hypothetical protein
MEWKLEDETLKEYQSLLRNAQDLELNIGSSTVRINKLIGMRNDIDAALKKWWDFTLKSMKLDPKRDYSISNEGLIVDVTREVTQPLSNPSEPSKVGSNAETLV